jgi:hypothetical protein
LEAVVAEVTNEVLIEELLKLDARLEKLIVAREEALAYMRETNKMVAQGLREYRELDLTLELRRLRTQDAAQ